MEQEVSNKEISHDERLESLSRVVSQWTLGGWNVVDKNERSVYAVMSLPGKQKPVNHVLHLLLSLATFGIWAIVWVIMIITHKNVGEKRVRLSIDAYGNYLEEKISL